MDEQKGIEQRIENSNSRFYEAFECLSIGKMEDVWKHSDNTICIHPRLGDVYRLDRYTGKLDKDI